MCFRIRNNLHYTTRMMKKTIVIIMRDLKIIPRDMGNLYKDTVKLPKRANICLTNRLREYTIR